MARPIDEKIVKMTLDNAKFKDSVKDTLTSFQSINDTMSKSSSIDISSIARSLSAIESRFSATGVVIATIFSRITNAAIDMGKGVYHAMVDPLVEGGKKRALNIEQAKFQFEGLGMDVEATMDSALAAVKGTAFGLDEAAVVASQFGATGMRAGDEMTEALRGISGVAAMTGASYSDIGNIFTTVAGNGRLMGNDLLRLGARGVNAAATLGKAMGKTEGEIREMVTKGEISFEDFAKAMSDAFGEHATKANETYTGSLSNLRAALARIGAAVYTPHFDNMKDVFNALTPVVDDLADAFEPLIEGINKVADSIFKNLISAIESIDVKKFVELGGMENVMAGFWNIMDSGSAILGAISEGFKRVFPGSFMDLLISATEGFKNLTSKLKVSEEAAEKLATIFEGVFSVFSAAWTIATELGKALLNLIPEGAGGMILDFMVYVAELAIAFNESVKEGNLLTDAIKGLGKILGRIGGAIKDPIRSFIDFARAIKDHIGTALKWLREKLAPVGQWFKDAFGDMGVEELLGGGFLLTVGLFLRKLSGFFDDAKANLDTITGTISSVFGDLGDALKSFVSKVKYNNLLKIAGAVAILAISMKLMEGMDVADIAKGLAALTGTMSILAAGMWAIDKLDFKGGIRASITLVALSISVTIMASALKKVSDLNIGELIKGITGLAAIVAVLSGAIIAISKWGGKLGTGTIALIGLATSIVILASAVKTMSGIETKDLFIAIGALGVIFAEIAIFLKIVNGAKLGPGTAIGLIGLATSIRIIVGAISKIAEIDVIGLTKGLVTIGIILAEIGLFGKLAGGPRLLLASVAITGIAVALAALMIPVTIMSKMSWEQLAKGLAGMATALIAVAAVGSVASVSILGAVGITVMAVALNALMVPILIFSAMSWKMMLKGFTGLAGALILVAGASLLLAPAAVPMLAFGGALLAVGAAVALVGAGIALFGVGLTALATLTATSIAAIVSSLGLLIKGFGSLITGTVDFLVEFGSALIGGFGRLVPEIVEAIVNIVVSMMRTFADHTPEFVSSGADIIKGVLEGIRDEIPELTKVALEAIVALVDGMATALEENGKQLVSAIMRLMGEVIIIVIEAGAQMIEALFGWIPGVKKVTGNITQVAEDYIRDNFGAEELGYEKGSNFATGLGSSSQIVGETGYQLANSAYLGASSLDMYGPGDDFSQAFNSGILGKYGFSYDTGEGMANEVKKGASSVDITDTASNLTTDYISTLRVSKPEVEETGKEIGKSVGDGTDKVDITNSGENKGIEISSGVLDTKTQNKKVGQEVAESVGEGSKTVDITDTGDKLGIDHYDGVRSTMNQNKTAGEDIAESAKKGAASVNVFGVGSSFSTTFNKSVTSKKTQSRTSGVTIAASARLGVASVKVNSTGGAFGGGFATGIRSKRTTAKASGTGLATSARAGVGSVGAVGLGANFGSSFARGIESTRTSVMLKAQGIASAATGAIRGALSIASPSKLLTRYGQFFGDGFGGGIGDRIRMVASKAKEMATRASQALSDALYSIQPEDEELRLQLVVDDSDIDWDDYTKPRPMTVTPDSRYTNALMGSTNDQFRQNENIPIREVEGDSVENNYNYEISVTAGGNMSRTEVRKLADQIQTEIKNKDDRDRMSRGEEVIF